MEKTMDNKMFEYIFKTLGYQMSGRLHTPKDQIGKTFTNPNGQEFIIFKQTLLDAVPGDVEKPEAMFRVQFRVPKISSFRDRLIISLKSPVFVALPGFRSKLWMVDEKNNTYQGVYEWSRLADAENYVNSYSMEFMGQVAVAGGLSYEIIPGGVIVPKERTLCIQRSDNRQPAACAQRAGRLVTAE
jgi:hypothetical protein